MTGSPLYGNSMASAPQALQMAYMRDPRVRLSQQLQLQGTDSSPVQHWTQGAARLAQALLGMHSQDKADADYSKQAEAYQADQKALYAPVETMQPSPAGAGPRPGAQMQSRPPTLQEMLARGQSMQSPYSQDAIRQLQMMNAQQEAEAAKRGTWKAGEQNGLKGQFNSADGKFVPDPLPRNPTGPQGLVAEYEYAKAQGFKGSILDYQSARGAAGRAPEAPTQEPGGPYRGQGMDPQDMNILLGPNADPTSQIYEQAYVRQYGPRAYRNPDGTITEMTPPVPKNIRPPVYGQPQVAQSVTPPGNQGAVPQSAPPPAAETTQLPGGGSATTVGTPRMSPQDRQKIEQATTDAAVLVGSLNEYVNAFGKATPGERATSVMGVNTPLNTSFSNAALMAKGEALFNLGVLNGPDLEIIRRTLPDPSTAKGQMAGPEGARAAAEQISRMIQDRITSHYRQKGLEPPNMNAYAAGLRTNPAGGDLRSKYGLE